MAKGKENKGEGDKLKQPISIVQEIRKMFKRKSCL